MPFRNTGEQEIEQVDTNLSSPTFGTKRWIVNGTNTTACPVPAAVANTFRSAQISETVYRDNCPSGQFPNGVTYTLAEGYNVSLVSQQQADLAARKYYDSQKQAFANANDTCAAAPASGSTPYCVYDTDGCWTGYLVDGQTQYYYTTNAEYLQCNVVSPTTNSSQYCPSV